MSQECQERNERPYLITSSAGEQRRRHFEAKRPCGLEVDHELELGRLLDCELGDDLRAVTF